MSRAYALVAQRSSPVFLTSPKLVAIYQSSKQAKAEAIRRNESNRTRDEYWVESVPYIAKETKE